MTFRCAHRGFTKAVNDPEWGFIGTGNVSSNTQNSTFVRSFDTTECNGFTFKPDKLRTFDLGHFRTGIPSQVKRCVLRETTTSDVILYRFFHYRGRFCVEHGWVITRTDHRLIRSFVTGPTHKSHDVIAKAASEVSEHKGGLIAA